MYTGIIEQMAKILSFALKGKTYCLSIASTFSDLVLGESIAVDGICLSVTGIEKNIFYCDVSPETLKVTTASFFKENTIVNLERSLKLGDRMGGHVVMGHVDQTAVLKNRIIHGECVEMIFKGITEKGQRFFLEKGSVCVNGVSLTVNRVFLDTFSVMLIPDTLSRTNLNFLTEGNIVNIEYDFMVKAVVRQLETRELII